MFIQVDYKLFSTLIECFDKLKELPTQPPEVQKHWKWVIDETYNTAKQSLDQFKAQNMISDSRTEIGQGIYVSPDKSGFV